MKAKTVYNNDDMMAPTISVNSDIKDAVPPYDAEKIHYKRDFFIISCDRCKCSYRVRGKQLKNEKIVINCPKCNKKLSLSPPEPKLTLPDNVSFNSGYFRLICELGEGGMGKVYLAKDKWLRRNVAIKVLKDKRKISRALFMREAQITAQLDHPNIVPLYVLGGGEGDDKNVSFVMKYIEGLTLSSLIKKTWAACKKNPTANLEKSLTLQSRLECFIKICEGVAYAHSKNVVHSDLKLSNIIIGDYGEVYIMDWGIAKITNDDFGEDLMDTNYSGLGNSKEVSLTIKYASPEQISKKPVSTLSDIFSLGIILYELVTLRSARNGSLNENIAAAKLGKINPISHAVKGRRIAPELKAIIQKATEFSPQNRYQSVEELANDIRSFLSNEEVSVQPYNLFKKTWRWMSKNKELAIIGALSVILLLSVSTIRSIYNEKVAIKNAKIREERLTQLQANASKQAYAMDSYFLHIEGLLKRLAATTEYLLNNAPRNDEKVFYIEDFKNPDTAPSDYNFAPLYNKYVSFDYPVAKLAPNVKKGEVDTTLKKLAPLRYHYFRAMVESYRDIPSANREQARELLATKGVPVRWVYLGTSSGVMFSFPGKSTYALEYDPRKRPWYALGANQMNVKWGNPYNDAQGQGLCLPCAVSIFDNEALLFGVMGMDITFNDIIRRYLTRNSELGKIEESYLLDEKGQIIISSNNLSNNSLPLDGNGKLLLKKFPSQAVVDSILKGDSGMIEFTKSTDKQIIAYYQLPSLQWYYVERYRTASVIENVKTEWME